MRSILCSTLSEFSNKDVRHPSRQKTLARGDALDGFNEALTKIGF